MDRDRWQAVQDLLEQALEQDEQQRLDWLAASCPDESLRKEVASLLAASAEARGYFTELAGQSGLGEREPNVESELVGRRIGAYRLEAFLGSGGMGTVWSAERADGHFSQRVAIKLLSMGAMNPEAHRRFLAEREILARLQHPGIARLFDGGVTEDGTPYFVMELVEGTPIDVDCDTRELGVSERIELFLDICDAVGFAHKNLVVHRDLKPGNILVAGGQVRLLDFGIAKLLEGGRPGDAATATGMGPMTPAYAAPEQFKGEPVTTATDVYALGVVLHELLTGLSPYESATHSGFAMFQAVCERPIANPSTRLLRLSTAGERESKPAAVGAARVEELAKKRGLNAAGLGRQLRGDLDTILVKALSKEPERRYESVTAFAQDLRRHLRDLPVHARKNSLAYRASRFLARHSIGVAAIAALFLLGAALLVVSLIFAQSQTSHSKRMANAERQADGLLLQLTELYKSADPAAPRKAALASKRLLDAAVESLNETRALEPEARARLLFEAGRIYRRIGALPDAVRLLQEAIDTQRDRIEAPDERLEETLYELGSSLVRAGRAETGLERLQEALSMAREQHGQDHVHVAQIRFQIGSAYHDVGGGDSEAEFREAVRIFRAMEDDPTIEYANSLIALGDVIAVRGRLEESLELYEEALLIHTEMFGEVHPYVATAKSGMGILLYNLGEKEQGLLRLHQAVDINREVYAEEGHPELAAVLMNLGIVLKREGDSRSIDYLREAVQVHRAQPAPDAPNLGFCLTSLGGACAQFEDRQGAQEAYEEALEVYASEGVQAMFQAQARTELARLLLVQGQSERAVELLTAVLEGYAGMLPDDHPRLQSIREELEQARAR